MRRGQNVTLRRYETVEGVRIPIDCVVKVVVQNYASEDLIGLVKQGERDVILLAEDVARAIVIQTDPAAEPVAWPGPPRRNDKLLLLGRELNIEQVDDQSRRVEEVLLAYELRIKG